MSTPTIPTKHIGSSNTYIICDYNNRAGLFLDMPNPYLTLTSEVQLRLGACPFCPDIGGPKTHNPQKRQIAHLVLGSVRSSSFSKGVNIFSRRPYWLGIGSSDASHYRLSIAEVLESLWLHLGLALSDRESPANLCRWKNSPGSSFSPTSRADSLRRSDTFRFYGT